MFKIDQFEKSRCPRRYGGGLENDLFSFDPGIGLLNSSRLARAFFARAQPGVKHQCAEN